MNQIDRTARGVGLVAFGILSCAIILVSACVPDSDRPLSGPQAAERGAQVFNDNCGFCHDVDGRGPKLAELKSLSQAERRGRIANHPMSGQIPQQLKAHELSDLIEYLESDQVFGDP